MGWGWSILRYSKDKQRSWFSCVLTQHLKQTGGSMGIAYFIFNVAQAPWDNKQFSSPAGFSFREELKRVMQYSVKLWQARYWCAFQYRQG